MEKYLAIILPLTISFLVALFLLPRWMKKAHQLNLVWDDMNKLKSKKVAGSGGIVVVLAFVFAVLSYIAYSTFYLNEYVHIIEILTILLVIVLLAGLGFVDDLLDWRRGGLSARWRIVFMIFASIPLMVINAGRHAISIPGFGLVDLGILYPLFFIPLGIVGAAATYNFLAGFNGLEAGQGIILLSGLSIVAYSTGNIWLTIIGLCLIASLFAFLIYNFCPAQVFPGNSITLTIGGLIAMISILGNFEKIAVFFFIPYILETVLKLRGNLTKQSFGKPLSDGSLDLRYDKIYGLEHLAIKLLNVTGIKATEKKVVYSIWIFQAAIIILGLIIFRQGIF